MKQNKNKNLEKRCFACLLLLKAFVITVILLL